MTELENALRGLLYDVADLGHDVGFRTSEGSDISAQHRELVAVIYHYANGLKNMIQSGGTRTHDE